MAPNHPFFKRDNVRKIILKAFGKKAVLIQQQYSREYFYSMLFDKHRLSAVIRSRNDTGSEILAVTTSEEPSEEDATVITRLCQTRQGAGTRTGRKRKTTVSVTSSFGAGLRKILTYI